MAKMPTRDEDRKLVTRIVNGDEDAFREFMKSYERYVTKIIYGVTHDFEDSLELTQEVFIRAYKNLADFRHDSSLLTWLRTIATRLAINHIKSGRARDEPNRVVKLPSDDEVDRYAVDEARAEERNPEELVYDRERLAAVQRCLEKLSAEARVVITMRDVEELQYNEIAEIIQIAEGTVKSRLSRARKDLQQCLGSQGVGPNRDES